MNIPEQVTNFLRQHKGKSYCDDCIRTHEGLNHREQSQRVTCTLALTKEFTRKRGLCVECGGDKLVTKANSK